ncbi:hypothetical protein GCM10019016_031550 [Streptomyces prasinosporus]|uniref:Integral membrane protein n=2 Tax=Streptomyces prasinosporus TaxID=68256 RepID=A0ABP6TND7_9ACTN
MTPGEKALGCLVLPGFVLLILPPVFFKMHWGHDVWGGVASGWPGGAYAFAATVGALVPLALLAWVVPLTRMNWRKSRPRSLAWVVASLPGLAACYLAAGVINAYARPKRRSDWDSACYDEGGPCWTHEQYPYLWAVGLAATLAVIVLLVGLFVKYGVRERRDAESSGEAAAT